MKIQLMKENKTEAQLKKSTQSIPPAPRIEDTIPGGNDKNLDIHDQYIKNIKFGISSIDTNLPLKRFI